MNLSDEIKRYYVEVEKANALCQKSRRLGKRERLEENMDELYKIGFRHYQFISGIRSGFQEIIDREKIPKSKRKLERELKSMNLYQKAYSEKLNILSKTILKFREKDIFGD